MDGDEDSDSDVEETVEQILGIEQPTLIEQLKTILAEYPDDGQIIKEIVQNAEDAGATKIKILYDGRRINTVKNKKLPYRTFFKGPCLCFYNNAVFSEEDWCGIRMIYKSIKKDQPLKVGRFGLGFKSVFHITDNLCIISGKKILLMNPLEKKQHKECIIVKLTDLRKCQKLNTDEFLNAMDGVFGFSTETLQTGHYNGTLFWFPLRETRSKLSDNIYDKDKVLDLFRSFQTEAIDSLLFLKSLSQVELYCKSSETELDLPDNQAFFTAEIQDDYGEVEKERKRFLDKINDSNRQIPSSDIVNVTHLRFKTVYKTTTNVNPHIDYSEWLVVNMFKGGHMSDKLRKLVSDKDLSYSPYAGVAMLLKGTLSNFRGHIFCFLPLPQETKSLTGLPIHVNGFFALSQNRRHLKWASADQDTLHTHRDKSIEWNECLVNEVLPEIYLRLFHEMIEMSQQHKNNNEAVEAVYRCFPNLSHVDCKWEVLAKGLFQRLDQLECVFLWNRGEWVKLLEPTYTMFDKQPVPIETIECVRSILGQYTNEETTTVPDHVWECLNTFSTPRDVSPSEVSRIFKSGDAYKLATLDEKMILLSYIIKVKEVSLLQDLELLPLENETFVTFKQGRSPVYVCSEEEIKLFPGLENRFVSTRIPKHLTDLLKQMAESGIYQIKLLTHKDIVELLDQTIQYNFGNQEPIHLNFTKVGSKFANWIKHVWAYIVQHMPDYSSALKSQPLLPLLVKGEWENESWKNGELHLYKLSQTCLVKSSLDMGGVSEDVYRAMEHFPIKILPSLPSWLDTRGLCCIRSPTQIFQKLQGTNPNCIDDFNIHCQKREREALVGFLANSPPVSDKVTDFLKKLKLFEVKQSRNEPFSKYVSLHETSRVATVSFDFPIRFPEPLIVSSSNNSLRLAKKLDAIEINEVQMVTDVLKAVHNDIYTNSEVSTFMKWFLQHITHFSHNEEIIKRARTIAFVNCTHNDVKLYKPSELYDPRDKDTKSLFYMESMFPTREFETDRYINAMKLLGLKSKSDVTAKDLLKTATLLDSLHEEDKDDTPNILQKAAALLQFLEMHPSPVDDNEMQIYSRMNCLRCIPPMNKIPRTYPSYLPWKGSQFILCYPAELTGESFTNSAGSAVPLISSSVELGQLFNWNTAPKASVLLKQLKCIVSVYSSAKKPQLLPLVSEIYKLMADKQSANISEEDTKAMLQTDCVWWGDGFCHPQKIVIDRRTDDIDLQPYMYHLPTELQSRKPFFTSIGCYQQQNTKVLLEVQNMVMKKHIESAIINNDEFSKDLQLIIQILRRLCRDGVTEETKEIILFPIHSENEQRLILKPSVQCTYCDAKWLQDMVKDDEENLYYVHSEVSQDTAEDLGVKSLRQHMMSDAEALEEWGQEEPLTRRLHGILEDGYIDGLSVPKELIQNADDAGAKKVCFVLDERENMDCRTQLLDEGMADLQGPALLAYNDALFTNDDLKNITKLNGGTKETDTTKIGKFGLGFCAVYNITDVPSFVSGHDFVIFDPHKKYLGKALHGNSPGLRINLQSLRNMKMMKRLHSQFKPFHRVLGCDFSVSQSKPFFNGTLFRLPLRTRSQAATSEIKGTCYSRDESVLLLKQLISSLGNMLLFTQTVESIQVFHIAASCTDPSKAVLLCSAKKEIINRTCADSVLQICSDLKTNGLLETQPFRSLQMLEIKVDCKEASKLVSIDQNVSNSHWLVSWATGTSDSLKLCYSTTMKGALPLGSVALFFKSDKTHLNVQSLNEAPFGFYKTGHMFCYLPLPIELSLPLHVNGNFAVTSDRRGLRTNTEDDKHAYDTNWNDCLLGDAIVRAFIYMLVSLHDSENMKLSLPMEYKFYQLWPVGNVPNMISFTKEFYQTILMFNSLVFKGQDCWIGIQNCTFLERALAYHNDLGTIAISTLKKFHSIPDRYVIDLPCMYFNEIESISGWNDFCEVVTVKAFFKNFFLPNFSNSYWLLEENIQNRNKLLLYCFEHSDEELDTLLKSISCIPTCPYGKLREPGELVHPHSKVSPLFCMEDERFPDDSFRESITLRKLICLGMMKDSLEVSVVIERAMSVPKLASNERYADAMDRCKRLLDYFAACEEIPCQITQQLQNISFLPVLEKPQSWPFSWKADDSIQGNERQKVLFETPSNLFHTDCKELVACQNLILNERALVQSSNIFSKFGVKSNTDITVDTVLEQLLAICTSSEIQERRNDEYARDKIVGAIYQYLEEKVINQPELTKDIRCSLENKPFIYLGNKFVNVSKVAFSMGRNCSPELYEIGRDRINQYTTFLKAVGVKEKFEVDMVIDIVKTKQSEFKDIQLPDHEFQLIRCLLEYLTDLMSQSELTYDHLISFGDENIVAPDNEKILRPTYQLCFDDCEFVSTTSSMKFVHSDLSRTCSEKLGVFTKRRKCIEDCSLEIPFEQKEELVTRLQGLLDGYPCDVGILKELIQNADDANATEIHFMIDFRTHGCKRIFEESYSEFQGPALCVFNNSFFSKADLLGIQNLGAGSKGADPCKTGQYGVGFNAVYNLTDMPSFLTKGPGLEGGETLCIFDPLHRHCKRKVGTRYVNMNTFRNTFNDVMSGYSEEVFFAERDQGTVFRFPLRQSKSDISDVVLSKEIVDGIFADFQTEMFEMLLFLKSVSKITVSDITSGHLKILYSVSSFLSDSDRNERSQFNAKRTELGKELKNDKSSILSMEPFHVEYEMRTKDNTGRTESWFVVQTIGFSAKPAPKNLEEAVEKRKIGLLPQGGVAVPVPLQHNKKSVLLSLKTQDQEPKPGVIGRAYCFMPLPEQTGMSMHINGHFVLDHEARRGLWKEDKGYKSDWNRLLISDVVAPAYIKALIFVKAKLFPEGGKAKQRTISQVHENIRSLESFFPYANEANGKYWKYLVQCVYQTVIANEERLFPIVLKDLRKNWKTNVEYTWNAFHQDGHRFPVFFVEDDAILSSCNTMHYLLKVIGMKISSTSLSVQQTMKEVGCTCSIITPDAVIDFLKSYKGTEIDKVKLPELPCAIQETNVRSVQNVDMILEYCSESKQFEIELDELPMLVTNDDVLRCFDTRQKVYVTEYCGLLMQSANKFVHTKLVHSIRFTGRNRFKQVIKDLRLADFAELLHFEVKSYHSTTQDFISWDPKNPAIPNMNWIKRLWEFATKDFDYACKSGYVASFASYLHPLQNWYLLPALQDKNDHILMKISKATSLIYLETFEHPPALHVALEKIGLPQVNKRYIADTSLQSIASCIVSVSTPMLLLMCLIYFRDRLSGELLREDCCAILRYFSKHLELQHNHPTAERIRDSLRSLPFFLTQTGGCISLDSNCTFLMMPDGMPLQGLDEWSKKTGIILIEKNYKLERLYKFLGLTYSDSIDVYLKHIFKTWDSLPDYSIVFHLTYIKECVSNKLARFKQNSMIEILRNLKIIPENTTRKKASDYFSPHHPVFAAMCEPQDFPPGCFREEKWQYFLELIGMKKIVTGQMFVQFAKDIASERKNEITQKSKDNSQVLVQCLLTQSHIAENDLKAISVIKFVVPHLVDTKYTNVHKQYSDGEHFICFSQSVSYRHDELSWTSMSLLPKWADPSQYTENLQRNSLRQFLYIHLEPPLDSIILHCQNICDSLTDKIKGKNKIKEICSWITPFMEEMYENLQLKGMSSETAKRRLFYTPVVFVPENDIFVQASQVVVEISACQEIKPYLLKAPRHYGKYFPLFKYLGATENPSFVHYIKVLSLIKEKVESSKLNIADWGVIRKAVDNMFKCLKEKSNDVLDDGLILYLPTREKCMMNAAQMIVCDKPYFEDRLGQKQIDKLHIFIGFRSLKLWDHTIDSIRRLPEVVRPRNLSEIVSQCIDVSVMKEVSNSLVAIKLENFLRSPYFIEGLIRLLKHSKSDRGITFTDEERVKVTGVLQSTKVRQVTGLKTYLLLNNERIDESERKKECYLPSPETNNGIEQRYIYFQKGNDVPEEKWLESVEHYLIIFFKNITAFKVRGYHIIKLLRHLNAPSCISPMLDDMKINAYELPAESDISVFPDPGTYVPSELHHLLNCDFSNFEEHEYRCVALELEDTAILEMVSESYSPVYIFVQILRKIPTSEEYSDINQTYEIFTGTDTVIVPAFKLYKFIRPDGDQSKDVVDTSTVPESKPLDAVLYSILHTLRAAWKRPEEDRRQIIKRLYLRWHPDKNIGNEEFCTKVFQYIKEVIFKLANGLPLDDEDKTDGPSRQSTSSSGSGYYGRSRAYPDFASSSYFEFCENLNRRCGTHRRYAQQYYASDRESTWRSGRWYRTFFSYGNTSHQEAHDPGEASRWLRQAKADLGHAIDTIDIQGNPAAFNWICYLCHQATEKSLKAAWFAKDANKVARQSHNLCGLAAGLNDRLRELAQELSDLVGEHTKMRYPDVLERPKIPSNVYSKQQAEKACELTREVVALVSEEYIPPL